MNNVLSHLSAHLQQFLPAPHSTPQPLPSQQHDTAASTQTTSTSRAEEDRELAMAYRWGLIQSADREKNVHIDAIPPDSTFGQWWGQLHDAFQSPDFVQWRQDKGIDTPSIKLDPQSGQITFKLQHHLDPSQQLHTVGQDDHQWAAISGPLLKAARVIGTEHAFTPSLIAPNEPVPLWIVALFYQEPQGLTLAGKRKRAEEIGQDQAFKTLDPVTFAGLINSRSEDELHNQKAFLGDIINRHIAAGELRHLATSVENGIEYVGQIQDALNRKISLSTHSTYLPAVTSNSNETSLLQFLQDHGWDIPTHHDELVNLAHALATPPPTSPANGNLGGAMTWPTPLDLDSQEQLRGDIRAGQFGDIALGPYDNVLEYLLNNGPITPGEQRNPRLLIDALIDSPRGKALGKAIQATFEARSVKGNATDWLLAALNVGNNTASDIGTNIEGYGLVSAENTGKTASAVVKELAEYLVSNGKASSLEMASVLAHLRLAGEAPEFLVKDIPNQVVAGTHSWVSFATAVARIEAKAPGATAAMTYAQVMLAANIAPVTEQERRIEYFAQNAAIKDWAVANGKHYPSTDTALGEVRKAFNKQISELREAAETQSVEMPTTRRMALEQLKKALPDMDPKLLEETCITSQPSSRHFPGPYSILDLFIDGRGLRGAPDSADNWGPAGRNFVFGVTFGGVNLPVDGVPGAWVSSSNAININDVLATMKDLPRPQAPFEQAFTNYANAVKKTTSAQLKHLIAKQPLQDRENLAYGKITIRREIDYHRADHPLRVADGILLVETERNGNVMTYELDRLKGTLTRRPDKTYQQYPPTDGLYPSKGRRYDLIVPAGERAPGITDEKQGAQGAPDSFGSDRTQYIVDAVIEDMDLPAVHRYAKGATTFETEVPTYKIVQEIALALIPLRSAINNFKEGKVFDGSIDLAFDIFGFAVGLGAAAKGAKGALAGTSALAKVGKVFQIVGRAAVGALNPLGGIDDLARGVAKGVRYVAAGAYKGVKQLRDSYKSLNLLELAKKTDIAEGTVRAANSPYSSKVLAKFDEESQQWFRFNPRTKEMYLKPLPNFTPDIPDSNDFNSLHAIGSHDAVKVASQQYGLAATGTFKVGQETVEGTVVMSQGNWHRYDALKKQPIMPPVTHFTPRRVAAGGEVRSMDAELLGYEAKYVAVDELSTKDLHGNVLVGRSKKEYVEVDGLLYESRLKEGRRVVPHPAGTGPDIPVKNSGTVGWEPASRSGRLPAGVGHTPTRWKLGDSTYVVPMDDIKVTNGSVPPFSLNYDSADHAVTFSSSAGTWKESNLAGGDAQSLYFWRKGKGKWQRGTHDEFIKAKKVDAHTYTFVDVSPPSIVNIPKALKPIPKQLNYFWAGQDIPSHLIDNITKNATQAPGYKSILHVDADSPAVFQRIKTQLESKVSGLTVMNLHEDEVFKQLKRGEMYDYFRHGQGKNLAAASDVARYPIMNKYGGIYLDTDDAIRKNVGTFTPEAAANDVLLGAPVVHSLTDYKPFYNTSNFATRPSNPVIEDMITEMHKRFTANKPYFASNRPTATKGPDGRVHYTEEFTAYERKIFETVGPNLFNDTLKSKRPDMYDLGLDGLAKDSKFVDQKLVASGPIVNVENDVRHYYASKGIVPPDLVGNQIQKVKHHYYPLRYEFNISVGADHSWINT